MDWQILLTRILVSVATQVVTSVASSLTTEGKLSDHLGSDIVHAIAKTLGGTVEAPPEGSQASTDK